MAKLTAQNTTPAAVAEQQKTAQPMSFTPQPISGPAETKRTRKTKSADAPAATKRIRGREWFEQNFDIGNRENVIQARNYPKRGGFKCAPCGIPGTTSFVIKGKDGRGQPLDIMEVKDGVFTGKVAYQVTGFEVGETCLAKYGDVDMSKPAMARPAEGVQVGNKETEAA